ncbi:hypothetical protein [Aequorivita sp. Q41]|uniref:hypothetical protein n=1 Tax=Aequorivita sp. Q41 TaxID=3153300 RepID=UPI003242A78F
MEQTLENVKKPENSVYILQSENAKPQARILLVAQQYSNHRPIVSSFGKENFKLIENEIGELKYKKMVFRKCYS